MGKKTMSPRAGLASLKLVLRHLGGFLKGTCNLGFCPICERQTVFIKEGEWLRDQYVCSNCRSIPRWRAVIYLLEKVFPNWRELRIHESSPSGAASVKLRAECKQYVGTHYFPDVAPGGEKRGFRCENLEKMTFDDASFDLVVTQDVFEHVLNPGKAFAEIARILKAGGAHVFTTPCYLGRKSVVRAVDSQEGIRYLEEQVYHGNPINAEGSLVVTDWGDDLVEFIYSHSGMATTIYNWQDPQKGLVAELLEVFVSRKPSV
jgi:hypothetical protein